jgi:hypothetical protein
MNTLMYLFLNVTVNHFCGCSILYVFILSLLISTSLNATLQLLGVLSSLELVTESSAFSPLFPVAE